MEPRRSSIGFARAAPASVTTLRQPSNRGKGEAVRAGMLAALSARPRVIGFFDADLSTPLQAVDDFLAVLRTRPAVELVLGSRVMLMGRDIRRRPSRHYLGRVFATAVSHALDLPVYDTQCGAKMLRVNAATASLFDVPFRSRWVFDVELIARYLRLPAAPGEPSRRDRIYELVLPAWHDRPGSKLRWFDFPRAMVDLGHIWRERLAHDRRRSIRGPLKTSPGHGRPGRRRSGNCGRTEWSGLAQGAHDEQRETVIHRAVAPQVHGHRGRRHRRDHDRSAPRAGRHGLPGPERHRERRDRRLQARHGHVQPDERRQIRQHRRALRLRRERRRQPRR